MNRRALALALMIVAITGPRVASAADDPPAIGAAVYTVDGELRLPQGYREWVFIGAPLTPNALNGGTAAFPEFHHVYVNPDAYAVYRATGRFPDGTVIAKELLLLQKSDREDGSSVSLSGRGYFADGYNGLDVMVKDSQRFGDTNGWGFFNFGHHAPPYLPTAGAAPEAECAACHRAVEKTDMVFRQFYPLLR